MIFTVIEDVSGIVESNQSILAFEEQLNEAQKQGCCQANYRPVSHLFSFKERSLMYFVRFIDELNPCLEVEGSRCVSLLYMSEELRA